MKKNFELVAMIWPSLKIRYTSKKKKPLKFKKNGGLNFSIQYL